MSIATEITRLQTAKADLKTAIEGKGVTVPSATKIDGYADLVEAIQTGGGGGTSAGWNDVNFWDYDGTIVASYSSADFANLSALPDNPSHDGLTAQGWNWTLEDAKAHVNTYGILDIGQLYTTSDGKTLICVDIDEELLMIAIGFSSSAVGNVTIDWGDGSPTEISTEKAYTIYSHTYAEAGTYVIALSVQSGIVTLGGAGESSGIISGLEQAKKNALRYVHIGANANVGRHAFYRCLGLKYMTFPASCNIPYDAKFDYSTMDVLILPHINSNVQITTEEASMRVICFANQSVLYTDYRSMGYNTTLKRICIPFGSLNSQAFANAFSLERIFLTANITKIDAQRMQSLFSLRKLIIPSSVTSIANNALTETRSIKELHMTGASVPSLGGTTFCNNAPSDFVIYVPYSADHSILAAYQSATNWSSFASKMQEEPQ